MVCQVCGRGSGYYPLCMEHYRMFQKGDVIKCPDCRTYCFKSEGCPICGDSEKKWAADDVAIRTSLLEKWGKRLYYIGRKGTEHSPTTWDYERYQDVLDISLQMKKIWDTDSVAMAHVSRKEFLGWADTLGTIAEDGLKHTNDNFDVERYLGLLDTAQDLAGLVESYEVDIEAEPPVPESKQIQFVADRDISEAWKQMIQKAEERVYIASPWIYGVDQFFEVLSEVKEKMSIVVKILVRPPEAGKESAHKATVIRLNKQGFHVEPFEQLHAKMIIVDGKEMYVGSANIIPTSVHENPEAGICTTEPGTVSQAMLYFEEKWEQAIEHKWK